MLPMEGKFTQRYPGTLSRRNYLSKVNKHRRKLHLYIFGPMKQINCSHIISETIFIDKSSTPLSPINSKWIAAPLTWISKYCKYQEVSCRHSSYSFLHGLHTEQIGVHLSTLVSGSIPSQGVVTEHVAVVLKIQPILWTVHGNMTWKRSDIHV